MLSVGCIFKMSQADRHKMVGSFKKGEFNMKRTLVQAMLILNYVINHSTDIEKVCVIGFINGTSFPAYTPINSLKSKSYLGEYTKGDVKDRIKAISKNNEVHVSMNTFENGTKWVFFTQLY